MVAAADLGLGGSLISIQLQKGWILCQEVTVQVLAVKGQAQDVVWDKARVKVKWAAHLPQGRAEVACVQNAEQRSLILSDSLAIKEAVLSVVRK